MYLLVNQFSLCQESVSQVSQRMISVQVFHAIEEKQENYSCPSEEGDCLFVILQKPRKQYNTAITLKYPTLLRIF